MEKLIAEQTLNHFGQKETVKFNIIFSGDDPNTVNSIRKELQSNAEVGGTNGEINVNQGKYIHKIFPLLATDANGAPDTSKAKYWGIASSMASSAYLAIHKEPYMNSPQSGGNGEDVSSQIWTYISRADIGICIVGAKWIKLSTGNGEA